MYLMHTLQIFQYDRLEFSSPTAASDMPSGGLCGKLLGGIF